LNKFKSALINRKEKDDTENFETVIDKPVQTQTPKTVQHAVLAYDYLTSTEMFIIHNLLTHYINTDGMDESIIADYNRVVKALKTNIEDRLRK
jgi:hypothetical protein